MATLEAKVFKHHIKSDGTRNVKIRVYHKGITKYIDTEHYLVDRQLKKDRNSTTTLTITDSFINNLVNKSLNSLRQKVSNLGSRLNLFSCDELRDYLTGTTSEVYFIRFIEGYIEQLKALKKNKTASNFNTIKNSLVDYFKRDEVTISEIDVAMLFSWETYLRTERTMVRIDQFQKPVITIQAPLKDASVHNYMRDLRSLFNHARKKFNKRSLGVIPIDHYPFEEYEIIESPQTKKRNCDVSTIKKIRSVRNKTGSRAKLARDLFMLSFYMCGINAVDLYQINQSNIVNGRLAYNRSKTKGKRKDNAFISIKIVKEAKPLLDKYLGKLQLRYSTIGELNKALSYGMRQICQKKDLPAITYYWARHSVGNLARNKCRMIMDDVALALNHVDSGKKTTDIYIEKDWSIVDELQANVIGLLSRRGKRFLRLKIKIKKALTINSSLRKVKVA